MPSFPTSFKALKIVAPGHQVAVEDVPFPSHALEAGRVLVRPPLRPSIPSMVLTKLSSTGQGPFGRTQPHGLVSTTERSHRSLPSLALSLTLAHPSSSPFRKHALGPWGPEPFRSVVTGCDAVGEVVQVGSAVAHLAVGDRIAGFLKGAESEINGAYADYAEFRQEVCFKLPQGMTPNEAAAFPVSPCLLARRSRVWLI